MNKERRTRLAKLQKELTLLTTTFNKEKFENYKVVLESIRDDEEWAFENMPEGLQCSARGMASEEAIECMNDALECMEEIDSVDNQNDFVDMLEEVISYLGDAENV